MTITNPEAIKFVNERIRPICETIRALSPALQSHQTKWFGGGISGLIPNDNSLLDDGREGEGASRLTGADINSVMNIIVAVLTTLNADIVEKPCIRPLEVN